MSNDRTVKFTLRLNMLNPVHVNINKVLRELDMDIFKSKNQFFIDAATYYIEHFGREALTEPKEKKEPQFISTEETTHRAVNFSFYNLTNNTPISISRYRICFKAKQISHI